MTFEVFDLDAGVGTLDVSATGVLPSFLGYRRRLIGPFVLGLANCDLFELMWYL